MRCVQLQMVIADIWEKVANVADGLIAEADTLSESLEESVDSVLPHVFNIFVGKVFVIATALNNEAKVFQTVHPQMWVTLSYDQCSKTGTDACEVCQQTLDTNKEDYLYRDGNVECSYKVSELM